VFLTAIVDASKKATLAFTVRAFTLLTALAVANRARVVPRWWISLLKSQYHALTGATVHHVRPVHNLLARIRTAAIAQPAVLYHLQNPLYDHALDAIRL